MSRLKGFKFFWGNCWRTQNWGYQAILASDENNIWLEFLVDGNLQKIDLNGKVDEFINDLIECKAETWNNKIYAAKTTFVLDGYHWDLKMAYDDVYVECSGSNAYPKQFPLLMKKLHLKYGLSIASIDKYKKDLNRDIKNTEEYEQNFDKDYYYIDDLIKKYYDKQSKLFLKSCNTVSQTDAIHTIYYTQSKNDD